MTIYNPTIPTGLINLDVDYKNIQNNFSQLDTTFGKNHFTYSNATANNGKHTFVQMVKSTVIPAGLSANEGTLYTKMPAAVTNLYYSPDNTGNEYQMTTTNSANFTSFGVSVNYTPPITNQNGGWTFLPGGLVLQYGVMLFVSGSTTHVDFPFPFATLFSLVYSTKTFTSTRISGESNSGFDIVLSSSQTGVRFYWQAIGSK